MQCIDLLKISQVSTAENGVLLVSAESPVPGLCTLGIMGKLGPRFESYDNAGSSQVGPTSVSSDQS